MPSIGQALVVAALSALPWPFGRTPAPAPPSGHACTCLCECAPHSAGAECPEGGWSTPALSAGVAAGLLGGFLVGALFVALIVGLVGRPTITGPAGGQPPEGVQDGPAPRRRRVRGALPLL